MRTNWGCIEKMCKTCYNFILYVLAWKLLNIIYHLRCNHQYGLYLEAVAIHCSFWTQNFNFRENCNCSHLESNPGLLRTKRLTFQFSRSPRFHLVFDLRYPPNKGYYFQLLLKKFHTRKLLLFSQMKKYETWTVEHCCSLTVEHCCSLTVWHCSS